MISHGLGLGPQKPSFRIFLTAILGRTPVRFSSQEMGKRFPRVSSYPHLSHLRVLRLGREIRNLIYASSRNMRWYQWVPILVLGSDSDPALGPHSPRRNRETLGWAK